MVGLTAIQARYTGFSPKNSEEFSSASRSVKPGLIASGIVSAWTWAATLVCRYPISISTCDLDEHEFSSNLVRSATDTASLVHGGMQQVRPYRSSCSLSSLQG